MSYNTNAKVNPFYIQDNDEEDPWNEEDYRDDDEYGDDDYDDEQVKLMGGSGNSHNRIYNVGGISNNNDTNNHRRGASLFERTTGIGLSYHDDRYEIRNGHRQHTPQAWKHVLIIVGTIVLIISGSSISSEKNGTSNTTNSLSLIDGEVPDDDFRIVVLGERHSGTDWMRNRIKECFPHADVSTQLQRMGYFFQDDEATARAKEVQKLGRGVKHREKRNRKFPRIIVVHVTLNAYDWLEQMRLSPDYAPDHVGTHEDLGHAVPLDWEEFLSKPWTTERPETDLPFANKTGPVCQMDFSYDEVVSCVGPWDSMETTAAAGIGDPMYELQNEGKRHGTPFASVLDLRSAKLRNHHGVLDSWPSVEKMIQVSYETTTQNFKTQLLHEILEFTGWNGGSYEHNGSTLPCNGNFLPPSLDSSSGMTLEFVDYVTKNIDWDTEGSVASYKPWKEEDIAAKDIRPATVSSSGSDAIDNDKESENKQAAENFDGDESQEETGTTASETMNKVAKETDSDTSSEETPSVPATGNNMSAASGSEDQNVADETKQEEASPKSSENEELLETEESEATITPEEIVTNGNVDNSEEDEKSNEDDASSKDFIPSTETTSSHDKVEESQDNKAEGEVGAAAVSEDNTSSRASNDAGVTQIETAPEELPDTKKDVLQSSQETETNEETSATATTGNDTASEIVSNADATQIETTPVGKTDTQQDVVEPSQDAENNGETSATATTGDSIVTVTESDTDATQIETTPVGKMDTKKDEAAENFTLKPITDVEIELNDEKQEEPSTDTQNDGGIDIENADESESSTGGENSTVEEDKIGDVESEGNGDNGQR